MKNATSIFSAFQYYQEKADKKASKKVKNAEKSSVLADIKKQSRIIKDLRDVDLPNNDKCECFSYILSGLSPKAILLQ